MFEALVRQQKRRQNTSQSRLKLRSGLIAGSTPSHSLLEDIKDHLGLENLLYPFGLLLPALPPPSPPSTRLASVAAERTNISFAQA